MVHTTQVTQLSLVHNLATGAKLVGGVGALGAGIFLGDMACYLSVGDSGRDPGLPCKAALGASNAGLGAYRAVHDFLHPDSSWDSLDNTGWQPHDVPS